MTWDPDENYVTSRKGMDTLEGGKALKEGMSEVWVLLISISWRILGVHFVYYTNLDLYPDKSTNNIQLVAGSLFHL